MAGPRFEQQMADRLRTLTARGLQRDLRASSIPGPGLIERAGRRLHNFSSNDYLGLALHPALIARAHAWASEYGAGATASRLVCGSLAAHQQVERKVAELKGKPAALVLNAGFQANQTILATLLAEDVAGPDPQVFVDRLIHASMYEGLKSAGIMPKRFRHNDLDHLDDMLGKARRISPDSALFILVESVYSMDGDRADLARLCDIADIHEAFVYVDEAHATGVLGPQGRGLSADPAVRGRIDLIMGTFGKALGGFGAYVAGSETLCAYLVNRCPGLIYTTAPPPSVLGAMDAALDLLPSLDAERERVAGHAELVRQTITGWGGNCAQSTTQVVPVILGREETALAAMRALEAADCLAVAIRPPTVPPGTARLRLTFSAAHSPEQVATLLTALEPVIRSCQ